MSPMRTVLALSLQSLCPSCGVLPGPVLQVLHGEHLALAQLHHGADPLSPHHVRGTDHCHVCRGNRGCTQSLGSSWGPAGQKRGSGVRRKTPWASVLIQGQSFSPQKGRKLHGLRIWSWGEEDDVQSGVELLLTHCTGSCTRAGQI